MSSSSFSKKIQSATDDITGEKKFMPRFTDEHAPEGPADLVAMQRQLNFEKYRSAVDPHYEKKKVTISQQPRSIVLLLVEELCARQL